MLEDLPLVEVSSTKPDLLLDKITTVLKGRNTDIKDTQSCCFDGTNLMPRETLAITQCCSFFDVR